NWIMELISDGSISNHITKEIYQFLFEFFSNLKLFPNNSIIQVMKVNFSFKTVSILSIFLTILLLPVERAIAL
ncbi:MAG: hypothetical protein SWX82_35100, partial [Cyanobacteriota bacterium]|nr:hypothetical protein [Cyanobacteriota bacterium]